MRIVWIGALLLVSSLAAADQKQVPTTKVPCLPSGEEYRIDAANGDPVVCWGASCMKLAGGGQAAMVPVPPVKPGWIGPRAEVRDDRGKPSVCMVNGECKPVGAKLGAAIAAERQSAAADQRMPSLDATADRKLVVVGGEVWNVAGDKRLTLKKPASYKSGMADVPAVVGIDVVGNLLLVDWADCAGPCTVSQLVDSSGKNRGKSFGGGGQVFQLDPKRFVAMSEYGEIHIFDLGGKMQGSLELGTDAGLGYDAIALDEMSIGVLRRDGDDAYRLVVVMAGEESSPRIDREVFLPVCAP